MAFDFELKFFNPRYLVKLLGDRVVEIRRFDVRGWLNPFSGKLVDRGLRLDPLDLDLRQLVEQGFELVNRGAAAFFEGVEVGRAESFLKLRDNEPLVVAFLCLGDSLFSRAP